MNGGNFIGPFIAGFMNDAIGWRWVQHWCALLLAFNFVLAFFLQEESMFERGNFEAEPTEDSSMGHEAIEREKADKSPVSTGQPGSSKTEPS